MVRTLARTTPDFPYVHIHEGIVYFTCPCPPDGLKAQTLFQLINLFVVDSIFGHHLVLCVKLVTHIIYMYIILSKVFVTKFVQKLMISG